MKIIVYSDYVCPFCYLSHHSLRQVLKDFEAEIEFHPYELRRAPTPKVDPMHDEMRLKRFEEVLKPAAQALGIEMKLPWISPHPYTTDAFHGYYFALDHQLGEAYNDAMFEAFYVDQKDIGEREVLCGIIAALGLDVKAFTQALDQQTYQPQVDAQWELKASLDVQGCPTFWIGDQKVTGYHTPEQFRALLLKESLNEAETGMACGPDGCH